ncbi:MAG TPA: VOC family protein [Candidatus Dormibacteraeota bacterium]
MAEVRTRIGAPIWIDIATDQVEASKTFYSGLFGWEAADITDRDAGGYGMFKLDGKDVAGVGPTQGPGQPTAWSVYIGTEDAAEVAAKVEAAGGTVVAPPFDVFEAGRMAVFQDPAGAFISVWQPGAMPGAQVLYQPNSFGWAELSSRDFDRAVGFYQQVFGWTTKVSPMGEGMGDYTEFQIDGESIAGGMPASPEAPAEMPSYWLVYFTVADLDESFRKAVELGATEMMPPSPYPGGRFAIVSDPQGAAFGLLSS